MYDAGVCKSFHPLQQSAVYADALARLGARCRWIELEFGRVLAVERGRLRLVLRGPVWPEGMADADRRKALRQLARWPGVTVVTPEEAVSGFGLVPLVTPLHHVVWRLGPEMRAGMVQTWRNALSQAERAGIRVTRGNGQTLERLMVAELAQRAVRRYRALGPSFTRALPADALRLWQWSSGGEMQAAMAFIRHGDTATYHLAWGSAVARACNVHHLMLARAAAALAQEGVRWLDLGAIDSEKASGLARFKLGTGAGIKRLGPTLLVLP